MSHSHSLDRRAWLKLGGLSLGALTSGAEPNLARLLAAGASSGPAPDRDFSVILFWANGGPSHLDTFDLKPDAPAEVRGPFRPIKTNVTGIHITEQLPQLARLADKFALVRSLHHNRAEHSGGTHRFLTGYRRLPRTSTTPSTLTSGRWWREDWTTGPGGSVYVSNTKFYGSGPGYLGSGCAPFMPAANPITSTGANSYDPVPLHQTGENRAGLSLDPEGTVILRRRDDLRRSLDTLPRALDDRSGSAAAFGQHQRRALELLAGVRTRAAFDLSREDSRLVAKYGDSDWGRDLLTARRLVEGGDRFVQCQANLRLRPPPAGSPPGTTTR